MPTDIYITYHLNIGAVQEGRAKGGTQIFSVSVAIVVKTLAVLDEGLDFVKSATASRAEAIWRVSHFYNSYPGGNSTYKKSVHLDPW